ncbi:tetratricopeptide repeat protein [Candidatus Odyssella thessalonicensis]|uniref:tetratricopeptide repeat protein n=1 Tax=Candidatus Odyssella thessalonicensis TaxID=84647 RepID=UPI000225ABDD|nr:sel1 repeat family protein [Candidatus Odyssella thessalonicensis]
MIKSIFLTTVCLFSTNLIAMEGYGNGFNLRNMPPKNADMGYDNDFDPRNQGVEDQNVRAAQGIGESKGVKYWQDNVADHSGVKMFQLGAKYYNAQAANKAQKQKNIQTARFYWSQAAQQGHADAAKYLGVIWQHGTAGEVDLFEAEKFYSQAVTLYENWASHGDENARVGAQKAKYYLANLYLEGGDGVKNERHPGQPFTANIDKAIKLYKNLADQDGSITAAYMLARAYYKIHHYSDAVEYFEIVCDSPDAEKALGKEALGHAKVALANIYRLNQDVPIDKSLNLYGQAKELGNKNAEKHMNYIGRQQRKTKQGEDGEHSYETL